MQDPGDCNSEAHFRCQRFQTLSRIPDSFSSTADILYVLPILSQVTLLYPVTVIWAFLFCFSLKSKKPRGQNRFPSQNTGHFGSNIMSCNKTDPSKFYSPSLKTHTLSNHCILFSSTFCTSGRARVIFTQKETSNNLFKPCDSSLGLVLQSVSGKLCQIYNHVAIFCNYFPKVQR